jgi:NADH-quinone oxidoreductase subunit M
MPFLAAFLVQFPAQQPSPTPAPAFGTGVVTVNFYLSLLIWVPVLVALAMAVIPNPRGRYDAYLRNAAFFTNFGLLALTLIIYSLFRSFIGGIQAEENLEWMPSLGIRYHLGVDGIGISMLILSNLVGVAACLASAGIRTRVREYFALLLLAQGAIHGVIAARDLFVLILFWSAASLPLCLLVLGWSERRALQACWRLLGYSALGTLALLAGGLLLYRAAGSSSFDFDHLLKANLNPRLQVAIGIAFLVAAATRLPIVPFHGWVRDVLAEAPVGVLVVIAGAWTRLGGYVLLRLLVGAEHDAARLLAPFIAGLGAATVIWAALAALRSQDLRRAGAYLALVPGGVTLLAIGGLTPLSLNGAVLSLFTGGLAAAAIAGAGATISERAQTRSLALLGGLASRLPTLSWLLVLAALALVGIPVFATFAADLMAFYGSIRSQPAAAFALALGLALTLFVVAALLQRVVFGGVNPDAPTPTRHTLSESWYLGILVGAILWVGVVPNGPKLAGVPIFDPGLVNVINSSTSDLASAYVPPLTGSP